MKGFNVLSALVVLLFLVLWAEPAAAVAYCPPEYQSCECSTGPNMVARCWECVWNPNKRTEVCGGVSHTASCACYEEYSNYIIINCWSSGSCQYQGQ